MKGKALIVTFGTGRQEEIKKSLFIPVGKSLRKGKWAKIVLVPSQETLTNAKAFAKEENWANFEIRPLPGKKTEDDADSCFVHCHELIIGLLSEGFSRYDIHADFTRGTKAMSAALVLAATMNNVGQLRYVTGERDPAKLGSVIPGTERIHELRARNADAVMRLEQAREFFRAGRFASVETLLNWVGSLDQALNSDLKGQVAWAKKCAEFYSKWDSFDFRAADRVLIGPAPRGWHSFAPSEELRLWVKGLAKGVGKGSSKECAEFYRFLAWDMVASASRKLEHAEHEEAMLRSYRVLELLSQVRLFENGYNPSSIPLDDTKAVEFNSVAILKGVTCLFSKPSHFEAARESGANFLKHLKDPMGEQLVGFDGASTLKMNRRNKSILIHGIEGGLNGAALESLIARLEALLEAEDARAGAMIRFIKNALKFQS